MTRRDRIELLPCPHPFLLQDVQAAKEERGVADRHGHDPFLRLLARGFADAAYDLADRTSSFKRNSNALKAFPLHMSVRIIETGHHGLSREVHHPRLRATKRSMSEVRPTDRIRSRGCHGGVLELGNPKSGSCAAKPTSAIGCFRVKVVDSQWR